MKRSVYLISALFLGACLPRGVQIPRSPAMSLFERKAGLISYIGKDGNVYVTDQAGTNTSQLTSDATTPGETAPPVVAYQIPTWSREGSELAFMGGRNTGTETSSGVYLADMDSKKVRNIYNSTDEFPIYISWSPDAKNIGMLTTAPSNQTIMLQTVPVNGGENRVLDVGSPFYWSWAPDGNVLISHKNGDNTTTTGQLAFLKLGSELTEYIIDQIPATFQAPAWSPDGAHILLTDAAESGRQEIRLADSTGANQETVGEFEVNTAFAWAQDSEQFAYIAGNQQGATIALGPLHVGDIYGSDEIVVDDKVVCFFWSPNSRMLAYFVPYQSQADSTDAQAAILLQLNILDLASGKTHQLITYQATDEFTSIVPYFDQYHQSITIWSPDSNNLVISLLDQDGNPIIGIIPASGTTQGRQLAEGAFATWSWK